MRWLAVPTAIVNTACMVLACIARDYPTFLYGWAGAVFAIWGGIYMKEEARAMGQTPMGYRSLAMRLRYEIQEEHLAPGTRLPTTAQYARRFATTRTTVARALRILAEEGIVEVVRGRGIYVTGPRTDRPRDRIEQILLDIIATHPAGTPLPETYWVALNVQASEMTVRRVEQRLADRGLIRRTRTGRYETL